MISTLPLSSNSRRPRTRTRSIRAADLFCGAGGTSSGMIQACEDLGIDVDLLAINHWPVAIATHSRNHPWAKHLCTSLDSVDPRKVVPDGHLNLLVASPECTHHSVARGGRPINDQSRASAWHVLRWAEHLKIDNILIENVREFRNWGPLDRRFRPIESRRGETYQAFLNALRSLGYRVEDRLLNAADYGDATTRERLFVIARRADRKIRWPEPSHTADPVEGENLFGPKDRWRAAREIIDWEIPGESIFARKRPLAPSTIDRIAAGLRRFCGEMAEPFLVMLYGTGKARSIHRPLPTVTANGQHIALVEPFVLQQQSGGAARSTGKPLPTIATKGAIALCEPMVVGMDHTGSNSKQVRSVGQPLATINGHGRFGVTQPFLVPFYGEKPGQKPRNHSLDRPLPTQPCSNKFGLVEPFVISAGGPAGQGRNARSVAAPLPTILADDHKALVSPYLGKYYGTAKTRAQSVGEPLDTITTKERHALVEPEVTRLGIDIRFRMLRPHELARAMGFEKYEFTGTKGDQVRQIGNAVPVRTAAALCRAILES